MKIGKSSSVRLLQSAAATAAVAGVSATFAVAPAQAYVPSQPQCGDRLEQDTTLTRDLDCAASAVMNALWLDKDGVTLDLNGHTITAPKAGRSGVAVENRDNVTITNGTIVGSQARADTGAIFWAWVHQPTVTNLTIRGGAGFGLWFDQATRGRIANNRVIGGNATRSGIMLSGQVNVIESNQVTGTAKNGIFLYGRWSNQPSERNVIVANVLENNGHAGINIPNQGPANLNRYDVVRDNKALGNARGGFIVDAPGSLVTANTAVANCGPGFDLGAAVIDGGLNEDVDNDHCEPGS